MKVAQIAPLYEDVPPKLYRGDRKARHRAGDLPTANEPKSLLPGVLGRISPEKRVDVAIRIAQRAGIPLKIATKVDKADADYFESVVKPLLDDPLVEFMGEIGDADKSEFLGNARALLFPLAWPEPFGLVMIESMACGTPVIAWNCGSVPEVVDPGITGFIVESEEQALAAIREAPELSRRRIRAVFERRFAARTMAEAYVQIYERVRQSRRDYVRLAS